MKKVKDEDFFNFLWKVVTAIQMKRERKSFQQTTMILYKLET